MASVINHSSRNEVLTTERPQHSGYATRKESHYDQSSPTQRHPPARPHAHPREDVRHRRAPAPQRLRSLNHIYTQLIDDLNGVTIASASSFGKKSEDKKYGGNVAAAAEVGKLIAERAKEKGIKKVVFDRGGYLYHGRVKALADAAREAGLDF